MRGLWPRWTLLPGAPFVLWALFWVFYGGLRWDHVALATVAPAVAYWGPRTKRLYLGLLPVALVGLLYDSMRFVKNWGLSESTVHVCDLRTAELRWFGVDVNGTAMTLQDWFLTHHHIVVDAICAIPYAGFIPVFVGYAIYLYFKDFSAQQRFTWTFLALNIAGFITYHVYPAAPPWYFHQYGCTVDLHAAASEGPNLARVDALMGIEYFKSFYGRSSDVFGAVPSLHVAYPLVIALEAWGRHRFFGRALSILFYVWMCFSAVYLDHHWVIDIALGSLYAVVAVLALRWFFQRGSIPVAEMASVAGIGDS
jgi:inositol phosphorylceramide synthase catalytic subunit